MGKSKREHEEQEYLYNLAQNILAKIKVIKECENHPDTYILIDDSSDSNERAINQYKQDHSPDEDEIKKFQSAVEKVLNDCSDICPSCQKDENE